MTDWDPTGEPTCELCGRDYVVASLARTCEQRHLDQPPDPGPTGHPKQLLDGPRDTPAAGQQDHRP